MKKKVLALLLVATMAAGVLTACGSKEEAAAPAATEETAEVVEEEATEEVAEAVTFDVEGEFEPNAEYAKYTLIEYTIEAIDATFVATVSANEDLTKFEAHCAFYGDEQLCVVEYDGSEFTIVEDKTGFLQGDVPGIITACLEQDKWAVIE